MADLHCPSETVREKQLCGAGRSDGTPPGKPSHAVARARFSPATTHWDRHMARNARCMYPESSLGCSSTPRIIPDAAASLSRAPRKNRCAPAIVHSSPATNTYALSNYRDARRIVSYPLNSYRCTLSSYPDALAINTDARRSNQFSPGDQLNCPRHTTICCRDSIDIPPAA